MFERKVKLMLKNRDGDWVLYKRVKASDWPPEELDRLSRFTEGKEFRLDK